MKYMILPILALLMISSVSAMIVKSVDVGSLIPGEESNIRIEIENTLGEDVDDVSFSLKFKDTPFIPVGSSQDSTDSLNDGDEERFSFFIRPVYNAKPGDYELPYEMTFKVNDQVETREGTIGLSISGNPELVFSTSLETPVIGSQGKIDLKIVNNGLADARFVSVTVSPSGYTLLSEENVYVGTISSDDFETASFDVIFNSNRATLNVVVEYKDLNNQNVIKDVSIPLNVYTREKALQLGIIKQSYTLYYIVAVVVIIVLWFIWRTIRKRQRMRRSLKGS